MFSILKQTVSALMGDVLPYIDQIAELTATGCSHHPTAAGLDVVKLVSHQQLRPCMSSD